VFVSNPAGSVFSEQAHLQVNAAPLVLVPPQDIATGLGSNVVFTVGAAGTAPLHYRWQFNGIDLPAATDPSLLLFGVSLDQAGVYTVIVSNRFGTTRASAVLAVLAKPIFTLSPISQAAPQGGTVALSVAAIGSPPIDFRWRRNRINVTDALFLVTPTNSTLVLIDLQPGEAGEYTVVASNPHGAALSGTGILTVLEDSDSDGLPDAWESARPGFNPTDPSDGAADSDGDGSSNAAEYVAGTDYLDPASRLELNITPALGAVLTFRAVSNRTYTLQSSDSLSPAQWRKLADILAATNSLPQTFLDPSPAANRYYRLATPMQP